MDIKNLDQALKLQKDLVAKLTHNLEATRGGKTPSLETLVKDKEQALARAQGEVEATVKERDEVVRRWDERVAQRQAKLVQLQTELAEIKSQFTARKKISADGTPVKATKKTRAKKATK